MTKSEEAISRLTSAAAIAAATPAQRRANAMSIAEGYIKSAGTRADFGGTDGFSYGYALGLTGGWRHGDLISENEMEEYRRRLTDAIEDREERDGLAEEDIDAEHAWSLTARLAALPVSTVGLPPEVATLIEEARSLHPTMANAVVKAN